MIEFFQQNTTAIYWFLGVIIPSIILYISIDKGYKKIIEKAKLKGFEDFSFIKLIARILKVFIILFVMLFITFYLVDKKHYGFLTDNIKTITYLSIVAIFTIVFGTLSNTLFNRTIKLKNNKKENPTSYKFLKYVTTSTIYILGIVLAALAFPALKGLAQTAVGGAGILAVIIGVASQEALANLIGGFFIIVFKPFQVHDIIKVTDTMIGEVMDITLRHTIIKNYQNKMIVIPNAIINKEKVINYNLGDKKCCQWIEVGISYDSDIDLAKEIMRSEAEAHPNLIEFRTMLQIKNKDPKVVVRVVSLDDSSVTLRAWAWAKDYQHAFNMKCDLYESIKKRFDKEGIEIPFPHRTLVFKDNNPNNLLND
ncbi:mechanosensitive ion channel family protein [uncultured Flavobacterium sp.]|uniref:mechanosensitive ion channel family protein n=1 Tax=uncultured Flavobacterium sp. TaxID=165435 RepID=UPI0030EDB58D|tara:strand:- start:1518 stop:2618 length:1101 start_codon:yes stop_codon:yes gene_type:complete